MKNFDKLDLRGACALIDSADSHYYRVGLQPILSDEDYDELKKHLKKLDPDNERLTRVGVPYSPDELRGKIKHSMPMGSLDNIDGAMAGFEKWYTLISKKLGCFPDLALSRKLDGSSICATYKNGQLAHVASRGDGEVGEDITANAVNFWGLPTVLDGCWDVDIRGEAMLYTADFKKIREEQLGKKWDDIPERDRSNPRNVGAGIISRDDGKWSNFIRFVPFNVYGTDADSEGAKMDMLDSMGLYPIHMIGLGGFDSVENAVERVLRYYDEVLTSRPDEEFEMDGIVVTLEEFRHQEHFITSDPKSLLRPKFSRAIKFPHKSNSTKIVDCAITVGHSRAIIPTAILEETRIGGANVTHALLNNWDEIERLGVAIGDTVEVVLGGDIIPKVTRLLKKGKNRQEIVEPDRCPSCGAPASREHNGRKGAVTYCSSSKCPAARRGKIKHWIGTSKKGVGILGIGDGILKALWDHKIVDDPADLYTLKPEDFQDLVMDGGQRIGESNATKIVKNIQSKRSLPLNIFLGSIGIEMLGRRRVLQLAQKAGGELDTISDWCDVDKLAKIELEGFGDKIRTSIMRGIQQNLGLINKLMLHVTVEPLNNKPKTEAETQEEEEVLQDSPIAGRSFCFTGTRKGEAEVAAMGGIVKDRVTKDLDYLVQKDPTKISNKTKKAESYGVGIISADFLSEVLAGKETL